MGLIEDEIVATIGIEQYENVALLRSLCVKDGFKNKKLGIQMLLHLFAFCEKEKIETLYLLTTTAEHYFVRYGFEKITRENTPTLIQKTREFQDICPLSACIMELKL